MNIQWLLCTVIKFHVVKVPETFLARFPVSEKSLALRVVCTLGARDLSCAFSGFGQFFKSDPREKPLDQSAIHLIAPSQLQPRLYQNIQNLDVLLIGS